MSESKSESKKVNMEHTNELAAAAWKKLSAAIEAETDHPPQWTRWSQQATAGELSTQADNPSAGLAASLSTVPSAAPVQYAAEPQAAEDTGIAKGSFGRWVQRHSKRIGVATAACLIVAVIATPVGNQALAAIMNKFRMQQVTVVKQDDLQQLLYGASQLGETRESVNKYGTFTQTAGKKSGEMDVTDAAKLLGRPIIVPKDLDSKEVRAMVTQANAVTFNIHVAEVNKAMSKLGATKLLPVSVDGKPITLEVGEIVYLHTRSGKYTGYSFSQQPVPVVTMDPSIPVAEALDAVLQFPLLPDGLKENLQKTTVLNGGSVPLPVITNGKSEKVRLDNVDVVITSTDRGTTFYTATWVKNGQLYTLNGGDEIFKTRQALLDKVTELVKL
jgi:hypothetical protein